MNSIPRKEKVKKYGVYSTKRYLLVVDEFDDIKEGLEKGLISKKTCRQIYCWNKEAGRENWNMDDVMYVLYPDFGKNISRNYFYSAIKNLVDLELMECVNPEEIHGRMYIITKKGERALGIL